MGSIHKRTKVKFFFIYLKKKQTFKKVQRRRKCKKKAIRAVKIVYQKYIATASKTDPIFFNIKKVVNEQIGPAMK